MAVEELSAIPNEFYAGDTVKWRFSHANFSSQDYELDYFFLPMVDGGGEKQTIKSDGGGTPPITKNADGSFSVVIPPATSTLFLDDTLYSWTVRARNGTENATLEQGRISVKRDRAAATGSAIDARSQVKRTLDALDATIEGKASVDQLSMSIGNRALSRMSPDELVRWRGLYATKYRYEVQAERNARGLDNDRLLKMSFNR